MEDKIMEDKSVIRKGVQQFFWCLTLLSFLVIGTGGCFKTGAIQSVAAVTYVSVMNTAPYSPTVDIYLNDTLVSPTGGIPAGQFSMLYGHLKPGNYAVQFKANGTNNILYNIPASAFDINNFYTLMLYNTSPGGGSVNAIKIHDDFSVVTPSNTYYRFFNLSPDAPAVDLYLNTVISQPQRAPADNATNTSFNAFTAIPPQTYSIQVKKTGTDSVLAFANSLSLGAGNVYTIFLTGKYQSTDTLSISVLQASF